MPEKKLSVCDIMPHVRFTHIATAFHDFMYPVSVAYDNRLFYVTGGKGLFTVGKKRYEAVPGTLIVIKHGCPYSCEPDNRADLAFLMFNFDFTDEHRDVPPFSPVEPKDFDSNSLLSPVYFNDTSVFADVLYLKNAQRFYTTLLSIYDELNSNRFGSPKIADLKFGAFLIDLARSVHFSDHANENRAEAIVQYILANIGGELSDNILGNTLHYHPNYIRKMVMGYTGMPTHRFVLECRLAKALELLLETDLSLKQICDKSGFKDFSHFTKAFKKKYGRNPSSYR